MYSAAKVPIEKLKHYYSEVFFMKKIFLLAFVLLTSANAFALNQEYHCVTLQGKNLIIVMANGKSTQAFIDGEKIMAFQYRVPRIHEGFGVESYNIDGIDFLVGSKTVSQNHYPPVGLKCTFVQR
jgi:hypothetical protein